MDPIYHNIYIIYITFISHSLLKPQYLKEERVVIVNGVDAFSFGDDRFSLHEFSWRREFVGVVTDDAYFFSTTQF